MMTPTEINIAIESACAAAALGFVALLIMATTDDDDGPRSA